MIGVGVELAVESGDHVESPPKRVVVVPLVDEEGEDLGRDAALEEPGEVHLAPYAPRGDLGELEPLPEAAVAVGDVLQDVGVGVDDGELAMECFRIIHYGFTRALWRKMR